MKTQSASTALQYGRIKNPGLAADRFKRFSFSSRVSAGVLLALIVAAALYTSSSVLASRSVSRAALPAKTSFGRGGEKTVPAALGRQNGLSVLSASNFLAALVPPPPPTVEAVGTFAVVSGMCTNTAQVNFVLGDQVCVRAVNSPLRAGAPIRRINFNDTLGFVRFSQDVANDPEEAIFPIPGSNTSTIDGVNVDNRGTWAASINDISDGGTRAIAYFNVSDPSNAAADLVVYDFSTNSESVTAGTPTGFFLWLSNLGPDDAANVHATMAVPPNMSYQNASTTSGFACALNAGVVDCSIASWPSGSVATITLNFLISAGAPDGVISSTANISSDINDPRPASNTAEARVEVRSPGAPPATCSLGCPANMVVTATGPSGAVVNFSGGVEVSGDCGSIQFSPPSGSTFPVGTTPVSVTSSTGGGSCSFTVEVLNTAGPTISCPSDQSAVAPSGASEVAVNTGTPSATGTGVAVTGDRSDNRDVSDPFPIGDTTIIWTATDSDQRSASCTQHVVVTSVDAPTISCPSDKTFDAGGDCQKTLTEAQIGTPTTGGLNPTTTSRRSDDLALTDPYPVGVTTITWTATNGLGSVSCTQKITITATGDTTPPTLTVPPDVNVTTNTCSALVDDELGVATATDSCSTVSITRTGVPTTPCPIPGNPTRTCETFIFPVGTTNVTYTATDGAGNQSTGVQHVTVHETSPPVFTFVPGNVGPINTGAGGTSCDAFVGDATLGTATVSDNCDNTVIRTGVPAGNIFPVGVTTITYTAKADLSVTAIQTVTVVDNTPPVVTGPADVTAYTGANATSCGTVVSDAVLGTATASDNCSGLGSIVRTGVPSGNFFPVGGTTVTYTVTDAHGNTSSATQTVTVVDNTPPVVTAPASVTAYTGANATSCGTVVSDAVLGTATASDNCSGLGSIVRTGVPSGNFFPVGGTTVTYTVTDAHGNTSSATQTVTVVDDTPPVLTLNGQTPSMWPPNHDYHTFAVTDFVTAASDNCGGVGIGDVVIEKVTSDEAENGNGSGNTVNDIVIAANTRSVQLRSEREGGGNGRVYTITFKVTDTHGNTTRKTAKVVVPHNPGETPVDSGVHYCKGSCP